MFADISIFFPKIIMIKQFHYQKHVILALNKKLKVIMFFFFYKAAKQLIQLEK